MRNTPVFNSRSHRAAILSLLIGAVLISFSGVWVKTAHVAPNVSAFYRVFFGGIILLAAAAYRGELKWHGARQFGISEGRISQLRREFKASWESFQGGNASA